MPVPVGDSDWATIVGYLKKLTPAEARLLGGQLGLNVFSLNNMQNLPDDMVRAWLRKDDDVIQQCGDPLTWEILASALNRIQKNGIANCILKDKCELADPSNDVGQTLPESAPQCPSSEKDNEKPVFTEADCKEIAQNPKFPRNSVDDTTSKLLESMVKIVIHTCNEHEYQAVLERLSPPSPKGSGKLQYCPELNYGTITAVVGKLAIHTVAVLFTQQSLEALIPLESALKSFPSVQAIVAIGIGYGKDRTSIKFADVMVSEKIEDCSQVKNDEGTVKQRGPRTEVDNTLLQHFRMRKMEWDGTFQVSKSRKSLTKFGIVVSAPILMKNKLLKREYMSLVDKTVGGEMEGFVLLNLVKRMKSENRQLSIIVIKGVADYGDSKKGDDWQFTAAKAAVDFVYYCFQKSNKNSIFCSGYTVKREYQSWCTWRYFFFFIIIPIFLGILLVYLTQF